MAIVVHTIFALVSNNEIKNVCVGTYPDCSDVAHNLYGDDAFAIEVTQYAVQEGDKYIDGEFRHYKENGTYEVIPYTPTDAQDISVLKQETAANTSGIDVNTTDITDIQVAIAELYESMNA